MEQFNPQDVKNLFNLSLNALVKGKLDDAKDGFEKIIAANPNSAEALLNLGNVYFIREQLDEAIIQFEKAINIDPTLSKAYQNIGACYFKKGKYENAIGYWNIACNLNPNNPVAHRNIAVAYEKINNNQKAFRHYEAFLKCNTKMDKTALKIERKVTESKRVAFHNLNVGVTLQKRKKWVDAALAFRKSIDTYPNFSKAHLNLGSIFYRNDKIDEAISSWEKALSIDPEHANTHCNLAIAYDKKQSFDEACYHYKMYLELTHGKTSDADKVSERVHQLLEKLQDKKELVRQHVNKANDHFSSRRYEEAIIEYKKYLTLNPHGADTHSVKERIEEAKTRLNPVEKALKVALKMGDEYFASSMFDKAIAAYNRYLSLCPTGSKANEVKQRLDQCHKNIGAVVSAMLKND